MIINTPMDMTTIMAIPIIIMVAIPVPHMAMVIMMPIIIMGITTTPIPMRTIP